MGRLMFCIGIPGHDHAVKSALGINLVKFRPVLEGNEIAIDPGMVRWKIRAAPPPWAADVPKTQRLLLRQF